MTKYQNLFSSFKLGPITLKNRIVGLPHSTARVIDGVPTDEDFAYFEERARGGAGLLITGATIVHPSSALRRRMLIEAYNDLVIPKLKRRTEAIHAHGAKIIGQILHLGREMIGGESNYPLSAPSSLQSPRGLYRPKELSNDEIADIVSGFETSAMNLKEAGYDGVEIHAAHGYLVAQFLSPYTNLRRDKYGGTLEGRMQFLIEIIDAIRKATGNNFVIGLRLSCDEEISDGMKLSDTLDIVKKVTEMGLINYLNITIGIRGAYVKDMSTPEGITIEASRAIRKSTNLPVIIGQRIKNPETAELILSEGAADLIGMARALIADPEWPAKVQSGRESEIIPCIACNQECRAFDPNLFCTVNPITGREHELNPRINLSEHPKAIAVIGGGPAGLEAAKVAAQRGHSVVLFEQQSYLGGQVNIAARDPNRSELLQFINYLSSEVHRLNVSVRLDHKAEVSDLVNFDAIIVATGATPVQPKIDRDEKGQIFTVYDVLQTDNFSVDKDKTAVVVDDGTGFWPAFSAAELLAKGGAKVSYVTQARTIGASIPHESIQPLLKRLGALGVQFMVLHQLIEINSSGQGLFQNVISGETTTLSADSLVIDAGRQQENTLAQKLKQELNIPIFSVGDTISPRRINNATYEAHNIARKI
ncbi:hypothetical protein BTR23_22585 [Alkalihalophilus pseudofirmus]|nr:hypothetical protein BTR23_22585 [Alkalihalophilus pseudofirmus]